MISKTVIADTQEVIEKAEPIASDIAKRLIDANLSYFEACTALELAQNIIGKTKLKAD